ncbi:MAG: T9SS type A sorting domain-containing protein [Reichenbachiella sp.]|uniref:T9SS type A sorting domain-containing protein n=1 Tax=Reichenbachiella sp. TaxID=2184521 RepID=UPI003263072F
MFKTKSADREMGKKTIELKGLLALIASIIGINLSFGQCPTSGTIASDCTTTGNLTVNGNTLTVNTGVTMTVTGTLTVRGTGSIIATGGNVSLGAFTDGNGTNTLTGGTYTVSGTFNTAGGGDFSMTGVTLNATGSASFSGSDISIINSNLILASMTTNLSTMTISNSTITTTGTGGLELEEATVTSSTLTVGGTLDVDSGTSTVSDSDLDVGVGYVSTTGQNAVIMNGGGKLYLNSNTTLDVKGDVQNNEMYINASHVVITGDFDNAGAEILEVSNAGSILVGGNYDNGGSGSTTAEGGGTIEVEGDFDNSGGGSATIDGGGMVVGGTYSGGDPVVTGGAEEGCSGGSGGCCGSACSSLPVTLISFNVDAVLDHVQISWKTATEINNDHFNIYRSTNGLDFELIEWEAGNGTTNEPMFYSIKDFPSQNGVYYYQLEQVDYDGKNEFFPVKQVNFHLGKSEQLNLYPMPLTSSENFYVSTTASDGVYVAAVLFDLSGNLTLNLPYELEMDRIKFVSSDLGLNAGIYLVKITIGNKQYIQKVRIN